MRGWRRRRPPPSADDSSDRDRVVRRQLGAALTRAWPGRLDAESDDLWSVSEEAAEGARSGWPALPPDVTVRGAGIVHEKGPVRQHHLLLARQVDPPVARRAGPDRPLAPGEVAELSDGDGWVLVVTPARLDQRDELPAVVDLLLARLTALTPSSDPPTDA